jgi:hypothetical protein
VLTGCGGGGNTVTGEIVYPATRADGEVWSVTMVEGTNVYNFTCDKDTTFKLEKVASGTYALKVMHYQAGGDKKASKGPPSQKEYSEKWTVPGGPYKLDLTKLDQGKPSKK